MHNIGPRNRAPLGVKTTNAKARAFQTPAPPQQTIKQQKSLQRPSTGRRSAKAKITIAPTQPVETDVLATIEDDDDDVPDIEYAPPPPIELPDPPMEFPYDQDFPQLQGANLFRGYNEVYGSPKDDEGRSIRLKKEEEEYESCMAAMMEQDILKRVREIEFPDPDNEVEAMIAAGPKKRTTDSKVNTVRARSAAAALSQSVAPSSAMKETASSLQKKKKPGFPVLGSKPQTFSVTSSQMRNTAATAVSKNTIGYPKAAKPRSIIPKGEQSLKYTMPTQLQTVDQRSIHPARFLELYGEPPIESEMWFRLQDHRRLEQSFRDEEDKELSDNLFGTDFFPVGGNDEEELFQLPMPD